MIKAIRFRFFSLLLLFSLLYQSGSPSIHVTGKNAGNVILRCALEAYKIVQIDLIIDSEDIDVCQTEDCSGRVFKQAACDVIIKDLSFSDAGEYTLRVHYNNSQSMVAQKNELTYQLHITDEISVKTGKPLKMHALLSRADKVEKNSSEGWTEMWTRTHGVRSNRMNVSDKTLIIDEFMDADAGTYRVLDTEGEILITVTVTGTESTEKVYNTEQHTHWIVPVGVCLILVLVLAVTAFIVWRRRHRRYTQTPVQENPEPPEVLGNL